MAKIASDLVRFVAKPHHQVTNSDRERPYRAVAAIRRCSNMLSTTMPGTDAAIKPALLLQADQRISYGLDTHSSQQKRLPSAEAYLPKWQSLIASSDVYGLTEDIAQTIISLGIKHRNDQTMSRE
ncbi:hypothetical protein JIR23_06830 [Bradyrhizobium diazoefficiens]|nr:hypothetical protein [Bradyrhizobium diazoefficiens]QQN65460.1 hypothetical protein JIR23_06830 [Bradyrhizobium diazoefficiens]